MRINAGTDAGHGFTGLASAKFGIKNVTDEQT